MILIYINESGNTDGPLILFLHGGGVSSWMWKNQLAYFEEEYHCLAPDLPGHGKSSDKSFSIVETAKRLLSLIKEKAQGKEVTVVGFSLGSQIALEMLHQNGSQINRVMFNSGSIKPMPIVRPFIKPLLYSSAPLVKWRSFSKLQAKTLHITEDDFECYFAEAKRMPAALLAETVQESISYELPSRVKEVVCKGLITIGSKENRAIKRSAKVLEERFPHFERFAISDVGHGLPLAEANTFNQLLERLLKA
ncbi:alpha/beta fold hydrolase [Shouchella patagoniensis]|uniref:alpha/beta fold hydrolase n=1 Tax=Shouchella patagoniensis TaxID=228576 RepID=UPI000995A921|nr:alpha/beta hydrolase [Shouchella patagoniensis]